MFDLPFDFFALAIAIVALAFARKAMNQVAELADTAGGNRDGGGHRHAVPPPLTPFEAFEQTLPPASPGVTPTPPPLIPDVEPTAPAEEAAASQLPVAPQHRPLRCRNPIAASRKPSAPAGWCGSAG